MATRCHPPSYADGRLGPPLELLCGIDFDLLFGRSWLFGSEAIEEIHCCLTLVEVLQFVVSKLASVDKLLVGFRDHRLAFSLNRLSRLCVRAEP